ncbi:vesicular acetylcholine transporter-like [Amphiura filiformis]|uniref:vesicular acetylcholine transporter-like n=1 Tax=Amphiura filiformis TaxID=82378 RepID=UPI003B20CC63
MFTIQTQLISCLGILTLEKIIHAMIAPLITQWDWATTVGYETYPNGTVTSLGDYYPSCEECREESSSKTLKLSGFVAAFLLISPITNAAFSPLSGYFGDKAGYDFALLLGLSTSVVTTLFFAFFSNFSALFSANLLMGIAGAFNTPNTFAKLNKLYPPDSDSGKTALGMAMTTNVFSFIGPAIVGILYEYAGQLLCFLTLFLPLQLILIFATSWSVYVMIHEANRQDVYDKDNSSPFDNEEEQDILDQGKANCFEKVLNHPKILVLSGTMLVGWLPRKCLETCLTVWMYDNFHSGPSEVGLVLSAGPSASL